MFSDNNVKTCEESWEFPNADNMQGFPSVKATAKNEFFVSVKFFHL